MEDTIRFFGIVLFIFGALSHAAILKDARASLSAEHLVPLRHLDRVTLATHLGPALPLLMGIAILALYPRHEHIVLALACAATALLLALRGVVHTRRIRGAGLPESYVSSYRKAYAINMACLAFCAGAFVYPLLSAT